jgi:hypothetical protein
MSDAKCVNAEAPADHAVKFEAKVAEKHLRRVPEGRASTSYT